MYKISLPHRLLVITLLLGFIPQPAKSADNDEKASPQKKLKLWSESTLADWWREHSTAEQVVSGTKDLLATLQSAQQQQQRRPYWRARLL